MSIVDKQNEFAATVDITPVNRPAFVNCEALTTTTISTNDLYDWLIAPKAQGGLGMTVLQAAYELWLMEWQDGAAVPDGFRAWALQQPGSRPVA